MLILKDYKHKTKTKYICDMCNKVISLEDKTVNKIHIQDTEGKMQKKWDLCSDCCKFLEKSIRNYKAIKVNDKVYKFFKI